MGLFTKKPNITSESVTAVCPYCGKSHTAVVYNCEAHYLDGTLQMPVEKQLSKYVECECGILFDVTRPYKLSTAQSEAYQQAAAKSYPDNTLRVLELLHAQYPSDCRGALFVQYYAEQNNVAMQEECMREVLRVNPSCVITMGSGSLPQIHLISKFVFREAYRNVDYLRRLGEFDEAEKLITSLRNAKYYEKPYELFDFLDLETKLIRKHNTQQQ